MDGWVLLALAAIAVSIIFCAWKNHSFSLITSIVCVFIFIVMLAADTTRPDGIIDKLAFTPGDLTGPGRLYTVLTSMYTHVNPTHLFFNLLALALIGSIFEQRIGTRRYILIYLITGLAGTLAFAAIHWNSPFLPVVGASGAISGVLGGFARKYSNEKMSLMFIPGSAAPVWMYAVLFVLIQFIIIPFNSYIAIESHLAGMLAGVLVTPYVLRLRVDQPAVARRAAPAESLRKLAVTPQLKSELAKIETETVPDVRDAWVEHFLSVARCPQCGAPLKVTRNSVRCERGHLL